MPKRVTSPTARPATGRSVAGAADPGRGAHDAGGVIAPLSSALPPLAEDASLPGAQTVTPETGAAGAPAAAAAGAIPGAPAWTAPEASAPEEATVARLAPAHEDGRAGRPAVTVGADGVDDATEGEPPDANTGDGRARRARSPLRRPRAWVAAGVAAVVVALAVWGGVVLAGDNAVDSARSAVMAVAAHDITVLSTYDYRHLAHDNALARQIMTPAEWKAYAKPADSVRATIVKDKAVATAKVQAVGIVRATADRVVVLAAVQQTINDNLLSGPATLPRSYEFTFVPVDGHWRVDYVAQL